AGSAVAHSLLEHGVESLDLVDTDAERAAKRAALLQAVFPESQVQPRSPADVPTLIGSADGLVNATPVGMHGTGAPLDTDLLSSATWVADLVYRPIETELIAAARRRGCRTLDG